MIWALVRFAGSAVLVLVIVALLAIVIVPRFLDRVYYRGPVSDHFDGARFFNLDRDDMLAPPTGGSRGGFLLRYLFGRDGRPAWPERVAVQPSVPAARVEGERMVVTWVGHATMLIQTQGLNILTDPVWSDRAGPFGMIGPRRVTAPGVAFDDLPPIDLVLVSHNHYDHLDLATLDRLWRRDRPRVFTSLGNDAIIAKARVPATALDWGRSVAIKPGIDVVVTPAHHWTSRWFTDRNRALWSGFVVRLPGGNLYYSGDTGAGAFGWADTAASYGPIRLALLPIGAFRFTDGQMASGGHMGPLDAVEAYRRTGAARAIVVHWGTFRLSYEGYDTPARMLAPAMRCAAMDPARFDTVAIGAPIEVAAYQAPPATAEVPRAERLACLDTPEVRALR
ncbi:MBL fold metallo-hydrolase [Hephaestia sp. GCM10023244]|uniref:MBL fold metallo-hydrolase n=1 Tax=unclassified Hephaestia TaxID=2631281 RepID=UPI0020777D6A|nr:MBL fold metallo-hydrolase [Hephaestia sp. MAHUQ-44]MCM8731770.1 MBL fold metallo-hydrolase [Hephaestia sp. MAHUQ-44]